MKSRPEQKGSVSSAVMAVKFLRNGFSPNCGRSSMKHRIFIRQWTTIIEATDWIVLQLTGRERRSSCAAGYKALWSKEAGLSFKRFFQSAGSAAGTGHR